MISQYFSQKFALLCAFTVVIFMYMFSACQSSSSDSFTTAIEETKIVSVDPTAAADFLASDLYSDVKVIPIFGGPYFDPEGVGDIKMTADHLYVADRYRPACVHVYSDKGIYERSLCGQVDGPDAYKSLWDFYVEDNGNIVVLDRTGMSINYYAGDKLLKKIEHGMYGAKFESDGQAGYYLYCVNERNANSKKIVHIDQEGEILEEFIDIDDNKSRYLNFSSISNLSSTDDGTIFQEKFNPYIYKFSPGQQVAVHRLISFGKYQLPEDFINGDYNDVREFMESITPLDYAHSIDSYFESEEHMSFSFQFRGQSLLALVKENQSPKVIRSITDDFVTNNWKMDRFNWIGPYDVSNNGAYMFLLDERAISQSDQEKIMAQKFLGHSPGDISILLDNWSDNYRFSLIMCTP